MRIDLDLIHRDAGKPLYGQLSALLRGAIRSGVYKPGERIEPWRAFMEQGDLSYPTVARAINDLTTEGLVVRRGGAGTFVADCLADTRRAVKKIGVFYYSVDTPAFTRIFAGIEQECALHGIEPIARSTGLEAAGEMQALRYFRDEHVDGIIASPMTRPSMQRELADAIHRDENVVILNMRVPQLPCDAITFNYEQAGLLLAKHLLKRHHRRIAVLGTELVYPNLRNWEVFTGIKQAYMEAGLPIPATIPQCLIPHAVAEDGPEVVDRLRTLIQPVDEAPPTALICTTGRLAYLAYKSLHRMKLRCPADVSVACIGEEHDAALADPPMTAIHTPLERLGRQAVRQIIDRFNQPERIAVHTVIDVSMAIRQSTDDAPHR